MTAPEPEMPEIVDTERRRPTDVGPLELVGLTVLPLGMISAMMPDVSVVLSGLLSVALCVTGSRAARQFVAYPPPRLDQWLERHKRRPGNG